MIEQSEVWEALVPLIDIFESLEIEYYIGGSVASSFTGVARATQDADVVADLRIVHARPFIEALRDEYYLSEDRLLRSIREKKSFNLIHLKTAFKVDVFVLKDTPYDRLSLARRVSLEVRDLDRTLDFSSPEDIILNKLLWYEMGNRVSDRQWYDLQGILRLRGEALDIAFMREWGVRLGISELLEKALKDVQEES